jgi:DNA polymerase-1
MKPYVKEALQHRLRLLAKTVVFGTFYGRSARSIAIAYGCTVRDAEMWQEICFSRYPGLIKYIKDRYHDFNTTKTVTTPWGRHRVITTPTQAFNTPVQSSASDVTMSTLVELHRLGFDLRLTVHDEIVFQVHKELLDPAIRRAKQVFERPIPQLANNQFPADFKYGENWYEMTKWEDKG